MTNINSILIEGHLVRDAELRTTPKGTAVCTFPIASNRYYKQDAGFEKEVSFFDIEAWAKLAESAGNLGRKGKPVRIVGRLRQDRWQDKENKSQSKVVIVAEHIEFRPEFKNVPNSETEIEEAS